MNRFSRWCRSLFTPRHKRIAQQAINSLNEALRLVDKAQAMGTQAIASLNRTLQELERTREELHAYRQAAMDEDEQLETLQRMAGEDAEEA